VLRQIGGDPFKYITSIEPSLDLLPLVQSVTPDFFFRQSDEPTSGPESGIHFVHWLKVCFDAQFIGMWLIWVQKFTPLPQSLIHRWEDYNFMVLCDKAWTPAESTNEQQSNDCHDILSQTSPQLMRILYAYTVFPKICSDNCLFRIYFFLGLSWEELRAEICPLRRILGDDMTRLYELHACSSDETFLGRLDCNSLLLDLAIGGLRAREAMVNCEMYWDSLE
jgi:hypothetical protein